jgi:hypothetical protein
VLLLQSVGIFSNLLTVVKSITLLQVVDGEQFIVFMAMVSHSKINGGAICSSCMHHLGHYPGYIQLFLLFDITGGLVLIIPLLWLVLSIVGGVSATILLKVVRYSVLLLELVPYTL